MKILSEHDQSILHQAISSLEKVSAVEMVVSVKPRSSSYNDIILLWGIIFSFVALTFFIFYPMVFTDIIIYLGPVLAFLLGVILSFAVKPMQRILIGRERAEKNVEIMGRAFFQKGGIRHTTKKTGLLIFISVFEKKICLIPDRGIEEVVPRVELEKIKTNIQSIFSSLDYIGNLASLIKELSMTFAKYMPVSEDDINELPDDIDISL